MKSFGFNTVNGVRVPADSFPREMELAVFQGRRWLAYDNADRRRKPGHQHWLMAPYFQSLMGTSPEPALGNQNETRIWLSDPRISGIVWTVTWRQLESAQGVYVNNFLNAALGHCQTLGKRLIVRIICKTFSGAVTDPVGANPAPLPVPDYIVNDHATYGGLANRGGIFKAYNSSFVHVGWGTNFENANVRARINALVNNINAQFGGHPSFDGVIVPDESNRSSYDGVALFPGHDQAAIAASNRLVLQYAASQLGPQRVWYCLNYLDDLSAGSASNDNAVLAELDWLVQQGYNVAVSDTYIPSALTQFMQPVYWGLPRNDLAPGRRTLSHVDILSMGANDANLPQRMIDCARQTYRLGCDITAWHPYPATVAGGNAAYWTAIQAAIDATAS